jgi:ribosomal protein L37AE/L43A
MMCQFCHQSTPSLIRLCVYTPQGIWVCQECYRAIDSHRHKPYSKIMDKLALLEAGYLVNRKLARNRI